MMMELSKFCMRILAFWIALLLLLPLLQPVVDGGYDDGDDLMAVALVLYFDHSWTTTIEMKLSDIHLFISLENKLVSRMLSHL